MIFWIHFLIISTNRIKKLVQLVLSYIFVSINTNKHILTMKKRALVFASILSMSILVSSCGVIFGGSRYNATIIAKDHPNAKIYVNGENIGTGTATGTYYRNRPLTVQLRDEGCENHQKTFDKAFRTGNFILSILGFGIIGIGVDLGTGAAYKPDHRNDAAITKQSDKEYTFTVEYPECNN